MTDEKQIEEIETMARVICNRYSEVMDRCRIDHCGCNYTCSYYDKAKTLYEQGYRKIPENAVVLTEEQLDEICSIEWHNEQVMHLQGEIEEKQEESKYWKSRCEEIGDVARKETAQEFYNLSEEKGGGVAFYNAVRKLAKELGAEVEE